MIDPVSFASAITLLFGAGFIFPFFGRRWIGTVYASLVLALAGSVVGIGGAIWLGFLEKPPDQGSMIWTRSWMGANLPPLRLEVRIDTLSAFFVFLIAAFSAVVAIYSFAALRAPHYLNQRHSIASAFNLFAWSTLIVVIANDVFSLVGVLEIMTLSFGYLALYKHNLYLDEHKDNSQSNNDVPDGEKELKEKNARIAPQVYLIVSHTSTAFLLIALLLLAIHAGSLSFDRLREMSRSLDPALATVIFLLVLVGLGIRAGLTPAHFWVSLVHPSSPTPTHALSLGIAIKVAIFLMFRFFFQFLQPQSWWGYVVLLLAVITALANVWYAIAAHDLKTALAYHSIENIGIITVGIGVALIFAPRNTLTAQMIAALALVAGLYHLLNHAVFKGLLYLCTGAIDNLTNQIVEFEKLGGLIKRYPWTVATFLVGAVSISGFPPFNGFVSEWLTLQALLNGLRSLRNEFLIGIVVALIGLVLLIASFALTSFCFVKITGITLLGVPRSRAEVRERWSKSDAPLPMRSMMVLMALLCLVLGLLPGLVVGLLSSVVVTILGYGIPLETLSPLEVQFIIPSAQPASLPATPTSLTILPLLAVAAVLASSITILALFSGRRRETMRPDIPWNCGTPYSASSMQYTGAALSFLIRNTVGAALSREPDEHGPGASVPGQDVDIDNSELEFLPTRMELSESVSYPQAVVEIFREVYNQAANWLLARAKETGELIQSGDLRRYLFYILVTNIAALILFLALRGSS